MPFLRHTTLNFELTSKLKLKFHLTSKWKKYLVDISAFTLLSPQNVSALICNACSFLLISNKIPKVCRIRAAGNSKTKVFNTTPVEFKMSSLSRNCLAFPVYIIWNRFSMCFCCNFQGSQWQKYANDRKICYYLIKGESLNFISVTFICDYCSTFPIGL